MPLHSKTALKQKIIAALQDQRNMRSDNFGAPSYRYEVMQIAGRSYLQNVLFIKPDEELNEDDSVIQAFLLVKEISALLDCGKRVLNNNLMYKLPAGQAAWDAEYNQCKRVDGTLIGYVIPIDYPVGTVAIRGILISDLFNKFREALEDKTHSSEASTYSILMPPKKKYKPSTSSSTSSSVVSERSVESSSSSYVSALEVLQAQMDQKQAKKLDLEKRHLVPEEMMPNLDERFAEVTAMTAKIDQIAEELKTTRASEKKALSQLKEIREIVSQKSEDIKAIKKRIREFLPSSYDHSELSEEEETGIAMLANLAY